MYNNLKTSLFCLPSIQITLRELEGRKTTCSFTWTISSVHFHIVSFDLVPSESKDLHFLFRFVGIKWVSKYTGDPNDRYVRYSNGGLQSGGQMARFLNAIQKPENLKYTHVYLYLKHANIPWDHICNGLGGDWCSPN